jgi:hypothetical protein
MGPLDAVHANPLTRIRWVTNETGHSWNTVWQTLHEKQLHPLHVQLVEDIHWQWGSDRLASTFS